MSAKDMQKFLDELEQTEGFLVVPHDGSRVRVHAPNGQMTFFSTKVGNGTALANAKAWARRHGRVEERVSSSVVRPTPASVGIPRSKPAHVPAPFLPTAAETSQAEEDLESLLGEEGLKSLLVEEEPAPVEEEPAPVPTPTTAAEPVVKLPEGHPAHPPADALLVDEGDGVYSVKVNIDPALAEEFLKWNIDNRPITQRILDSYARMMAEGGWVPAACPPIHFADTGKLTDGQKRLLAIIKSGTTQRMTLVLGLPESSQDVVDTGQHRLVAHQLKINRFRNPMVVAAAARVLWLWDHRALISHDPSPSNPELVDYASMLAGEGYSIEDSASVATGSGARKFVAQSVLAASHFRMSRADSAAAAEFHEMLSTGAGMESGSPVLALRETMIRRKDLGQRLRTAEQLYFVVRAWQLWRAGTPTSRLQFPRERLTMAHFPDIT